MANNEIGTIQKIDEIAAICDEASVYLHLDAVQAVCHTELNLETLGCDLLSISAHKFHGPKGIGILYIKEGTKIENLLHGGQQEHGLRAGTENVPYIVGIATALEHGITTIPSYENRLNEYAKYIIKRLDEEKIDYLLNGTSIGKNRLPGNLN